MKIIVLVVSLALTCAPVFGCTSVEDCCKDIYTNQVSNCAQAFAISNLAKAIEKQRFYS